MPRFGAKTTPSQRRKVIASWTTMTVFAAALTAFAVHQRGYPTHHANLNNGGIWVSSPTHGLGLENHALGQLESVATVDCLPTCARLDVLQDRSAVFAVGNNLTPVDVQRSIAPPSASVSLGTASVALGGTGALATLATLDRNGNLRLAQVAPDSGQSNIASSLSPTARPIKIGASDGLLAVGSDGAAYVAAGGQLTRVLPSGSGYTAAQTTPLSPAAQPISGDGSGQAAVVGGSFAYATGPTSFAVNGKTILVDPGSVLQQSGDGSSLLIGTDKGLVAADPETGRTTTLTAAVGVPSQPIGLGGPISHRGCAFGAWYAPAGDTTGTVVSVCGGKVTPGVLVGQGVSGCMNAGASPLRLRSNHGQVVVNNICTGDVWPVGPGRLQKMSDWQSVIPKPAPPQHDRHTVANQDPKPKAQEDHLGVRAGSQAVLHVLDNDTANPGALLAIDDVVPASPEPNVNVVVSPDRQTLLATAGRGAAPGVVQFRYSIDDGSGNSSSAPVYLTIRPVSSATVAPTPAHPGQQLPRYAVASGGTVNIPVVDAFRDRVNGDQLAVYSPSAGSGLAGVSPEGMLSYTAKNGQTGPVVVAFSVGTADSQNSMLRADAVVDVVGAGHPVAPKLEPDVVTGAIVNHQPAVITIHPLRNDIPGADASDPSATLQLAGVSPLHGATSATYDASAGTIQVTADATGDFSYQYTATYGGSSAAKPGLIRVIVRDATSAQPVTVPDQTTLYGQQPKTVDVLANDFDPLGRVLVLQSAAPSSDSSGLEVGVVDNRWLRIIENDPSKVGTIQTVSYQMNAGGGQSVPGTVSVAVGAENLAQEMPVVTDDHVVVRAGDAVTVPVLDNDSVPSGAPLAIANPGHSCAPAPCGLSILSNDPGPLGTAALSGATIRYVAPQNVATPISVQVPYTAINQNLPGQRASGTLWVQVNPKPVPVSSDQAPSPRPIEARVIQGDTITIKLPSAGMDPDGDSVSLTGIGDPTNNNAASTVPTLGQVLSYGGNTISYRAFPNSSGTDSFSYVVTDTYGKSAVGTIQVGVVPPDAAQQPVPVDDFVTIDPSRTLRYNVMANDIHQPGQDLKLAALPLPERGVTEDAPAGTILVDAAANPVTDVPYQLQGPLGVSVPGHLHISYRPGFDNAPVAGSVQAPRGTVSVKVDLSSHISDIDDTDLTIDQVQDPLGHSVTPKNDAVSLPVAPYPVAWTYRVTDPSGAAALGTIYVPASSAGGPYLKSTAPIQMSPGGTFEFNLSDFVADSSNKQVLLRDRGTFVPAPTGIVTFGASTATSVQLHASNAIGVGSVSFGVTDGKTATSSDGIARMITVPVVIGTPKPVLSCPTAPITVYSEGDTVPVNVSQYCHVWTPVPGQAGRLSYTASTSTKGLSVAGGAPTVDLTAAGAMTDCKTMPNEVRSGSMTVTTAGVSAKLNVAIRCVPPAQFIAPRPFSTTTKKGSIRIDLTTSVSSSMSPSRRKVVVVGAPTPIGAVSGKLTFNPGSAVGTFVPKADGKFRYSVQLNDAGGAAGRTISGQIEIDVAGVPDPPQNVYWRHNGPADLVTGAVFLTWDPPKSDGHDPNGITDYLVAVDGGQPAFVCQASPCHVTGLANSTSPYRFQVRAVNSVGRSAPSPQVIGFAGKVPDKVTNPRVATETTSGFVVTWAPPRCVSDGSCKIDGYAAYADAAGTQRITAVSTSLRATIPATVTSSRAVWISPVSSALQKQVGFPVTNTLKVVGQASGKPGAPVVSISELAPADSTTKQMELSWNQVAPNGPGPVTYRVTTSGPPCVASTPTATNCTISAPQDGSRATYSVTATNSGGSGANGYQPLPPPSYTSAATQVTVKFTGTPQPVTIASAHGTGVNGQASIQVHYGASNGSAATMHCLMDGGTCPSYPATPVNRTGDGGTPLNVTLTGVPNGSHTFEFYETNEGGGTGSGGATDSSTSPSDSRNFNVYGPISHGSLTSWTSGNAVYWRIDGAGVDANGKPVRWKVDDGPQSTGWITTGTGATGPQQNSFNEAPGTYTVTLTIEDTSDPAGGPPRSVPPISAPPVTIAPPPNPVVTLSHGSQYGPNSSCPYQSPGFQTCYHLHVALSNFVGQVTCTPSTNSPYSGNWSSYSTDLNGNPLYNGSYDLAPWHTDYGHYTVSISCTDGIRTATDSTTW